MAKTKSCSPSRSYRSRFFADSLYFRMGEDLHLGGMSQRTHDGYLRAVLVSARTTTYCEEPPRLIRLYAFDSVVALPADTLSRFSLRYPAALETTFGLGSRKVPPLRWGHAEPLRLRRASN